MNFFSKKESLTFLVGCVVLFLFTQKACQSSLALELLVFCNAVFFCLLSKLIIKLVAISGFFFTFFIGALMAKMNISFTMNDSPSECFFLLHPPSAWLVHVLLLPFFWGHQSDQWQLCVLSLLFELEVILQYVKK